jgi:hypothetical protein
MAKPKSIKTSAGFGRGKQTQAVRDAYSDTQALLRGKEKAAIPGKVKNAFKGAVDIMAKQKPDKEKKD